MGAAIRNNRQLEDRTSKISDCETRIRLLLKTITAFVRNDIQNYISNYVLEV